MVPSRSAVVVLVFALAGCASDAPPGTDRVGPPSTDPDVPPSGDGGPPPPGNGLPAPTGNSPPGTVPAIPLPPVPEWGSWSLEAQGQAGEWMLAYQPFATLRGTGFSARIEASATGTPGTPLGLLVLAPQVAARGSAGIDVANHSHLRLLASPLGTDLSWSDEYMLGDDEAAQYAGMFVAIAATGPWRLSIQVDAGDGPAAQGTFVSRGEGSTFWHQPGTPVAGTTTLDADIPSAGWTHLMVPVAPCPRSGTRSYDIRLPDGTNETAQSQPIRLYDYIGRFSGIAGPLHAAVEYSEVGVGTSLALMHMPADPSKFPPGFDLGGYRRSSGEPSCA